MASRTRGSALRAERLAIGKVEKLNAPGCQAIEIACTGAVKRSALRLRVAAEATRGTSNCGFIRPAVNGNSSTGTRPSSQPSGRVHTSEMTPSGRVAGAISPAQGPALPPAFNLDVLLLIPISTRSAVQSCDCGWVGRGPTDSGRPTSGPPTWSAASPRLLIARSPNRPRSPPRQSNDSPTRAGLPYSCSARLMFPNVSGAGWVVNSFCRTV